MNIITEKDIKYKIINETEVSFAFKNGLWVNATSICKKYGMRLDNYFISSRTTEYVEELIALGVLTLETFKQTVVGKGKKQGVYLHPSLVLHFARWVNVKFSISFDIFTRRELIKIQEDKLRDLTIAFEKEKTLLIAGAKKLNTYQNDKGLSMITLGKYKELHPNIHKDTIIEALKKKGWISDIFRNTVYRRLTPSCPTYVGDVINGSRFKGTVIFTEASITSAIKDLQTATDDIVDGDFLDYK